MPAVPVSPPTSGVYTYAQLEALWINAGGPSAVAPLAAAIAEAESSGRVGALNKTDNNGTQTSVGLWQVSNGTHVYPASWATATGNAAEAVAKYKGAGNSFAPWGTYTSGAYKAFLSGSIPPNYSMPKGQTAATTSPTTSPTTSQGGASTSVCLVAFPNINPVPSWVPLFGGSTYTCLFRKTQARALIGGGLLLSGGLVMFGGLAVLGASAFGKVAGKGAVGKAAGTTAEIAGAGLAVAGAPELGAPVAAAGGFAKSRSKGSQARQYATGRRSQRRAQDRHDTAQYDQVMARKSDTARGPAVRDREPVPF